MYPRLTPELVTSQNPVTRIAGEAQSKLGTFNAAVVTGAVVGYVLRGLVGAALGAGLVYWQQAQAKKKTGAVP